jgi:hypothetical protein
MRFPVILTLCIVLSALCGGCVRHYKVINGITVEVLSPSEELEMKSTARAALAQSKALTIPEQEMIKNTQPELKIRYTGDRMGDATVRWKLPGKTVSLFIRGVFFDPTAQWMMKIQKDQPEYLDLRNQNPR